MATRFPPPPSFRPMPPPRRLAGGRTALGRIDVVRSWAKWPVALAAAALTVGFGTSGNYPRFCVADVPSVRVVQASDGVLELREGEQIVARLSSPLLTRAAGTPSAEVVTTQGHRLVVVRRADRSHASASTPSATTVWIGLLESGAARAIWSGVVGPLDADGEITRGLDVGPAGLALYETVSRVSRCDAIPVRLGWRHYDFSRGRFVPFVPPASPGASQSIVARRVSGKPRPRPRVAFPFTMASAPPAGAAAATEQDQARALVAPLAVSDGDPETVWRERREAGAEEILTARAAGSGFGITGLEVLPGDPTSPQRWAASGRARSLTLILGPSAAERFDVTLEEASDESDHKRPFWIPLPRPVPSSCVTIVPREVAHDSASAAQTLAWAEVTVFTDFDGPTGIARLIQALSVADCASHVDDVVALGPGAAPTLIAALSDTTTPSPNGRRCMLEALSRLGKGDAKLAPDAARALESALPALLAPDLDVAEQRLLSQVVSDLRPAPVAALRALLDDANAGEGARVRAARLLAGIDDDGARAAIVDAVGKAPAVLRAELRRLAATPRAAGPALRTALAATPIEARSRRADLAYALGAAASRPGATQDRSEAEATATMLAALALDAKEDFEVRARAVQGLSSVGGERAVKTLVQISRTAEPAPLRLLATRGLATVPDSALAAPALRAAIADADPAVREAAVSALGGRRDPSARPALIEAAKQEPWPLVRRAEIAALGRVCGPGAGDLLIRAVERDVLDVRKVALAGLAACRDSRSRDLLLGLLRREPEAPPLRTEAARLLGQSGDRSATPAMAAALQRMTVQSQDDLAIEETALTTVDALARLGGQAAVDAVLTLRTDARPAFRRAVAQALGRACEAPQTPAALREASRDSDAAVATAARTSLRQCEAPRAGRPAAAVVKTRE
jgi:HEAT repeat protein